MTLSYRNDGKSATEVFGMPIMAPTSFESFMKLPAGRKLVNVMSSIESKWSCEQGFGGNHDTFRMGQRLRKLGFTLMQRSDVYDLLCKEGYDELLETSDHCELHTFENDKGVAITGCWFVRYDHLFTSFAGVCDVEPVFNESLKKSGLAKLRSRAEKMLEDLYEDDFQRQRIEREVTTIEVELSH